MINIPLKEQRSTKFNTNKRREGHSAHMSYLTLGNRSWYTTNKYFLRFEVLRFCRSLWNGSFYLNLEE